MRSVARIHNSEGQHTAEVSAGRHTASISIASKLSGFGSSVSGGELLMLAFATCFCNDIYREALQMNIEVVSVDVECSGDFPAEGAPATSVKYTVSITARAPEEQIRELAARTDREAEVQNTVRAGMPVELAEVEIHSV
jgi:organic hydroperoxide reductase OsmC/OhrA